MNFDAVVVGEGASVYGENYEVTEDKISAGTKVRTGLQFDCCADENGRWAEDSKTLLQCETEDGKLVLLNVADLRAIEAA